MEKEVIVRIMSTSQAAKHILHIGAVHTGNTEAEFYYFNQPDGSMLKINRYHNECLIVRIAQEDIQLRFIERQPAPDFEAAFKELDSKYGFKKKLVLKMKNFRYKKFEINIITIAKLGHFLAISGKNPSIAIAKLLSGQKNPEIVTESFDNL